MVTKSDLANLHNYSSNTGHVLSIYLDVDQSNASNLNRGFEAVLDDQLRVIAHRLNEEKESRDFESCASRARDFVSKYVPNSRGVVVYSKSTGSLWARELDVPTRTQLRWDDTAFIQPLVEALDEYQRYAVIAVDRMTARIYTIHLGKIEKCSEVQAIGWVRHVKSAGKDHLYSQSRFQRRSDEHVHSHLKRVVELLETFTESTPFERLILAGTTDLTSELHDLLPKSLRARVVGSVSLAANANDEDVVAKVAEVEEKAERGFEMSRVEKLLDSAGGRQRSATTVAETLKAINEKRIRELIYAERFPIPGGKCRICGAVFESAASGCDFCEGPVEAVEDVTEPAASRALACGASVEQVRGQARDVLISAGGLGGFLRY